MIHCLNPNCTQPGNPENHRFCQNCGWRLRLGDRYEALYPIGTGRNSRTFLGRDRTTLVKPQCLIKRFTPTGATRLAQETTAEKFRNLVSALAISSQHPQIPDLLGYFEREQQQFLVQQFLAGSDLVQFLKDKGGPFSSEEILALLRDTLPVLQHLHRHRIIHRDIKPSNWRRPTNQGHWWLVDLGAMKPLAATHRGQPGTVVGSAEYIAPEQLRGAATFASDIYSLGVICLQLLTGLRPFDLFDSVHGCWRWHSIVPDVDKPLALILDGMVQPAVSDRIGSVETLMAALGMANPSLGSASSPQPPKKWTPHWEETFESQILAVTSLPSIDALLLLTTAGTIEVRALAKPQTCLTILTLEIPDPLTLVPHPHVPLFVVGSRQGGCEVWSLVQTRWQCRSLSDISHGITQCVFTSDGETLIGGDHQGRLCLWDWAKSKVKTVWQEHTSPITALESLSWRS
ncbi:MAG: protein kinase, partial [Leptolyngbya sp. SIO1D8]|nr:protein kinase [Leptolyngbya sp. SIO1D8]